ncbi:MAG: NnrS family protein [Hyphomicrobiales bacterium]
MKRTAETRRTWKGAALWSRGFRPFFSVAGLWAVVAMAVWPPLFAGEIGIPTAFSPVDWHVHEMIFGYGSAVAAGFLLTAIPNWTGRLPVAGRPLALLCALWMLGRVAVFASAAIGRVPAAALDAAFLLVFAAVAAREVIAGRSLRNVKVVALVLVLAAANVGFHVEAAVAGAATDATRASLAVLVFLILLIGGRVVPSFTHNWLAKRGVLARPVPFGRADGLAMGLSGLALVLWVVFPDEPATGACLLACGVANLWRLSRWRGLAALSDRLVVVLHVGFLFAALGFLIVGARALWPDRVPAAAGLHVWAVGAIGTMTLAMMTRATLGHTGRDLAASGWTQAIYLAVIIAAAARLAMEWVPSLALPLMCAAALAWIAAFAGFVVIYGPMLTRRAAVPGDTG